MPHQLEAVPRRRAVVRGPVRTPGVEPARSSARRRPTRAPVQPTDSFDAGPVLIFSGGVDTVKMDVHNWCITFADRAGATVLAFDMPGTGENPVLLGPASDAVIQNLVTAARGIGNGLVAHFGISFGGNFSALTGLTGTVDAAIVLGGPVDAASARRTCADCLTAWPTSSATPWDSTTR